MSYDAYEVTPYSATPVFFYVISNGTSNWFYTSAEYNIVGSGGNVYQSEQITHSAPSETQELNKSVVRIDVPQTNTVARLFQSYPPTSITSVAIYALNRGEYAAELGPLSVSYMAQGGRYTIESLGTTNWNALGVVGTPVVGGMFVYNGTPVTDTSGTVTPGKILVWSGRVISAELIPGGVFEFSCEPIITSMRRLGLRRFYQRECPHLLYGSACGVASSAHAYNATIASAVGLLLSISSAPPGGDHYYAGGMLSWDSSTGTQWRFITDNSGDGLFVNLPTMPVGDPFGRSLPTGSEITIYPGCAHTLTDCLNKFNNIANYGGFPYTPLQNPFGATTLF